MTDPETPPETDPGPPPAVSAVQRFGFHRRPTLLVLTFSRPLDPTTAGDLANYSLVSPGRDGRFGTRDDRSISLRRVSYDPAALAATLRPRRLLPLHMRYRLTVNGSGPGGLTDLSGSLLDGDADGQPGGDFIARIDRRSFVRPAGRAGSRAPMQRSAGD